MTASNESSYPDDWRRIAEKDWHRTHYLLDLDDYDLAGFCLQQAVEKYLKAYLLSKGWALRRIHHLGALIEDAAKYAPELAAYQSACITITAYYFVERYPIMSHTEVTEEDIRTSIADVEDLIGWLRAQFTDDDADE